MFSSPAGVVLLLEPARERRRRAEGVREETARARPKRLFLSKRDRFVPADLPAGCKAAKARTRSRMSWSQHPANLVLRRRRHRTRRVLPVRGATVRQTRGHKSDNRSRLRFWHGIFAENLFRHELLPEVVRCLHMKICHVFIRRSGDLMPTTALATTGCKSHSPSQRDGSRYKNLDFREELR